MSDLKPCPFCGYKMNDYTISFKRDRRKVNGVYHEICTIKCPKCTCSISQAGVDRERAEVHALDMWNRRVDND